MPNTLLRLLVLPALIQFLCPSWAGAGSQERLESLVAQSFRSDGPGGVVIVRQRGQTLLHHAYGMADLELAVPMTTAHRLAAGSITKPMTAAGILLLVQQGKLGLDDDVRTYLPSVSPGDQPMTIAQLLTHTSGFPTAVDREDFEEISRRHLSLEDLLALTEGMDMHFAPGTAWRYSDSGYFLLGAVIESLSGLDYAEFIRTQVFEPAGLKDTLYGDDRQIIPRRASGYSKDETGYINAPYIDMSIPYSAGAIYTTAEDLADWVDALRGGTLFDQALLDRAWTSARLADGTSTGYGFGWNICEISGQRAIGHGGFINGFTANLEHLPESDLTIAVLTNQDAGEPEASYLVRRIARLLITGAAELHSVVPDTAAGSSLAASYRYPNGNRRRIFFQDGALWSQRNDRDPLKLVPLSETYFAFPDTEGSYGLEFVRDEKGKATRVVTRLDCTPQEIAERISD